MTAYDPGEWQNLFVAVAGASAALTGLLFVAVSINLAAILADPSLPLRAVETLGIMVGLLVQAIVVLVPGQSTTALGIEIAALGVLLGGPLLATRQRVPRAPGEPKTWKRGAMLTIALATVPVVVAGLSIASETGGGLYWLVPGLVFGFVGAVANAWVLLVEIHR